MKEYCILNSLGEGNGVAKITDINTKKIISFDLNSPLKNNEIFKGFILNGNDFSFIGDLNGVKCEIPISKAQNIDGIVILKKNVMSKNENISFWWSKNNNNIRELADVLIFKNENVQKLPQCKPEQISKNETEEITSSFSEESTVFEEEPSITEENSIIMEDDSMEYYSFDNFSDGGFSWQRIGGYYCIHNYSILKHIMSGHRVYEYINKFGYYYVGEKKHEDTLYIAVAIPAFRGYDSPFNTADECTYVISEDDILFYTICVGIDDKGEFFVEL